MVEGERRFFRQVTTPQKTISWWRAWPTGSGQAFGLGILRIGTGAVFLCAGMVKVTDPAAFWGDIAAYRLVPHWLGFAMAVYLPWLEIICGALLMARKLDTGALVILLSLMVVFTLAVVSAWVRGLDIACGCFSSHARAAYPWLVARDLVILGLLAGLLPHR